MDSSYTCAAARMLSKKGRQVEAWCAYDVWCLVVTEAGEEPPPSNFIGLLVLRSPPVARWKCAGCDKDEDLTEDGYCPKCSTGGEGFEGGLEPVAEEVQKRLERMTCVTKTE